MNRVKETEVDPFDIPAVTKVPGLLGRPFHPFPDHNGPTFPAIETALVGCCRNGQIIPVQFVKAILKMEHSQWYKPGCGFLECPLLIR